MVSYGNVYMCTQTNTLLSNIYIKGSRFWVMFGFLGSYVLGLVSQVCGGVISD